MEVLVAASSGAIAGLISGVIGSLIGPLVQWAIEKRRNRQNYRRELIKVWRDAIDEHIHRGTNVYSVEEFSRTAEYSRMRLYLSSESRQWIEYSIPERQALVEQGELGAWADEAGKRRKIILGEFAKLEQKWGLV